MSDALNRIYNRMSSAQPYRPGSTTIFDDMTLEAGDSISIVSDGSEHRTLLSTLDLTWNGNAMVGVNSQGQEKRDSLSVMSKRKYDGTMGGSGGGAGYRNSKKLYTQILQNNERISLIATKTGIDGLADDETLYSKIEVVAGDISLESTRARNAENSLSGRINVQSDKISLVVTETSDGNVVNAASIVTAINNGSSSILLDADKIALHGSNILVGDVIKTDGGQALVDTTYLRATTAILNGVWIQGLGENFLVGNAPGTQMNLQTVTIDGVEQTAKFLGTSPLSFSVADTQIYQTGVSAAGALTASWSGADVDNLYNDTYTVRSGTGQTRSTRVTTLSTGWQNVSANNPGSCTVYAYADGEIRGSYLILGNIPYQQGMADAGGGTSDVVVSGSWSGTTYTAVNNKNSSSASTRVSLSQSAWDSNWRKTISINADGNVIDSSTVVYAQSVHDHGVNSVTVSSVAGTEGTTSTVSIVATASNGATKTGTFNIAQGAWDSSWNKPVYVKSGDTVIGQVNISGSSVHSAGANEVDFKSYTFSGNTHITTTRTMYAHITNGKQKGLENQLLLDYNSGNGQDGWFGTAPNYQKYVFWRTAAEGTTGWSSRMRGTISGKWVYEKGLEDGASSGSSTVDDITCSVPSVYYSSAKPSGYTQLFTGGSGTNGTKVTVNNRYFSFQARLSGHSGYKGYCFYVSV